jgi:hypothetical protein
VKDFETEGHHRQTRASRGSGALELAMESFCRLCRVAVVIFAALLAGAGAQSWPACYQGFFGCNAYALSVINQFVLNGTGA